jgi:glycerophosphoryl diester phosphodiesterase
MKKEEIISRLNPKFFKGICHRGYWNEEFTENGLKAFENALNHDMPLELDIHLTTDGELVVCHDENLIRTTGKEGIIEHMSSKEIRENYRLKDGGVVPTLKEVFDLINEKVPMVIELKVFEKNYKPLAAKLKEFLSSNVKDKKNFMLISFDPRSLWPLKKEGYVRSLLVAKSHEYVYNLFGRTIETYDLEKVLFEEKRIQKLVKKTLVNAWTIEGEDQIDKILPYVDTVTFQHMDNELVTQKLKK